MKIFNWPKDGQEDIDPAVLKRFNINLNDYKKDDDEDLVEDSDEESDDDDEFVSIEELEEDSDEEDKYHVDDMKNNRKNRPQPKNCCNDGNRVLVDLFKRQMQNKKLSDSEVVENLSKVIIAAFRRAKEELVSESPAKNLFSALEDYSDPYTDDFEEPVFPEPGSDDFFYVPKTEKQVKRDSYNITVAKIAALITLYMRQGKIEKMFVKITDLNQFYFDLNDMNLILVNSVINVLKRTGNEKTNLYLNHINKVISQMGKIPNTIQQLKFYLKAVNLWRNQKGPKFADIAYKTFVDSPQVEAILSSYQLAILPEEFSKMMSGILNQMIF